MPVAVQYPPGSMNSSPGRSRAAQPAPHHHSPRGSAGDMDMDNMQPIGTAGMTTAQLQQQYRSAAPPAQRFSTHDDFYDFLDSNRGPAGADTYNNRSMNGNSPSSSSPRQNQQTASRPPVTNAIPATRRPSYTYSDSQSEDMMTGGKNGNGPPSPAEVAAAAARGMGMMGPRSGAPPASSSSSAAPPPSSRRPVAAAPNGKSTQSATSSRPTTRSGSPSSGYRHSSGYPEQQRTYGSNGRAISPGPDSIPPPGSSIPLNSQMAPTTKINNNNDQSSLPSQSSHHQTGYPPQAPNSHAARFQQQQQRQQEEVQRLKSPSVLSCVLQPLDQKVREYDDHMGRESNEIARLDEEIRILQELRDRAERRFMDFKGKHDEYQRQYVDVERAMRGGGDVPANFSGQQQGRAAAANGAGMTRRQQEGDYDDDDDVEELDEELDEEDGDLDGVPHHEPGNKGGAQQKQEIPPQMLNQHRRAQSQQSFGASSGNKTMRTRDRLRISLFGGARD